MVRAIIESKTVQWDTVEKTILTAENRVLMIKHDFNWQGGWKVLLG